MSYLGLCERPEFATANVNELLVRVSVRGAGGVPLTIRSVALKSEPHPNERWAYVESRPWLTPYEGPSKDFVSRIGLRGKVLTGYQGWFRTANDLADSGWSHWGRRADSAPSPSDVTVDMWPRLDEYAPENLYQAGSLALLDGAPAKVFSSTDPETVHQHFKWMRQYGIDGVYLQRFVRE